MTDLRTRTSTRYPSNERTSLSVSLLTCSFETMFVAWLEGESNPYREQREGQRPRPKEARKTRRDRERKKKEKEKKRKERKNHEKRGFIKSHRDMNVTRCLTRGLTTMSCTHPQRERTRGFSVPWMLRSNVRPWNITSLLLHGSSMVRIIVARLCVVVTRPARRVSSHVALPARVLSPSRVQCVFTSCIMLAA